MKFKRIENIFEEIENGNQNHFSKNSGFKLIDNFAKGFRAGQFSVLGARPGVGKTTFMVNILNNLKTQLSKNEFALILSLEMSNKELIEKLISITFDINLEIWKSIEIDKLKKSEKWIKIKQQLSNLNFLFIDECYLEVEKIDQVINEIEEKLKIKIKLLFLDHIQLLETKNQLLPKVEKVSIISRTLKTIAKNQNISIFGLSQISREYSKTAIKNSAPKLSDLKNSGSIEQDADLVYFLHESENGLNLSKTILQLTIAKNRNGHSGNEKILFDKTTGKMISAPKPKKEES